VSTAASQHNAHHRQISRWGETFRRSARAIRIARDLRAALFLSPNDLATLRRRRLIETITHAYQAVPYYRRLLGAAGVSPGDIRTENDLLRVPVTPSDALRSLPSEDLVSSRVRPQELRRHVTSGSTGTPFVFYRTADSELQRILGSYRVLLSNGVRWRDRLLFIGLNAVFEGRWLQRLGLLPARVLSALTPIEVQVETLRTFRPTVLACYPSSARALAAALLRSRADVPPIRLIFTSGETLDQHTADVVTRVFGVSPQSTYGCLEVGNLGWQCGPEGPFHTGDDVVILEILREGTPVQAGQVGEVVVTSLVRRDMPFIRYSTGDLARPVPRSCACRHAFGQIEPVGGRVSEVLVLPDGSLRSALSVTACVHRVPGVLHFQLQQDRVDHLRILVVAADPLPPAAIAKLRAELSPLLPGVAIVIEEVSDIRRGSGGKLPYVLVSPALRASARLRESAPGQILVEPPIKAYPS